MLDQVDRQLDVHRAFDRRAHDLALAHRVVAVAEREQRTRDAHAEVNRVAGADLGAVHVAAEGVGNDRRARFAVRRRNPETTEKGARGTSQENFPSCERARATPFAAVDVVEPDRLREVGTEHRGSVSPLQRAEAGKATDTA